MDSYLKPDRAFTLWTLPFRANSRTLVCEGLGMLGPSWSAQFPGRRTGVLGMRIDGLAGRKFRTYPMGREKLTPQK